MKKNVNSVWLFFCSLMPGAGYMYLGLMQRGVEAMLLFMAGIVIPVWVNMPTLCALIIVPLWFYCFFDTFYQRNNLEAGLDIDDHGLVNLLNWVNHNYHLLGIGLIGLGILALLNTLGQDLAYSANAIIKQVTQQIQGYLPPILLIAAGIYLLRKTKNHALIDDEVIAESSEAMTITPSELAVTGEEVNNQECTPVILVATEEKADQ